MLLKDAKKLADDINELTRRHKSEGLDPASDQELRAKVARACELLASKRGGILENEVKAKILALMEAKKAFTAWNVTEAIRGRGVNCEHWKAKDIVFRLMSEFLDNGVDYYCKVTVPVVTPDGMATSAILWHPKGFDPGMFSGSPVSADEAALTDAQDAQEDDEAEPSATRYFSRDGQLYVPRSFSARVSGARATIHGEEIVISDSGDYPLTTDAKGNIRLTRRKIQQMLNDAEGSASAGSASDRATWETTYGCNVRLSGDEIIARAL